MASAARWPDWPSALISLSMSYSTRRIESVAPSIKRYDANLPTMICANRLAAAVLFSIGCAGLPAARTVQSQAYFKQTSSITSKGCWNVLIALAGFFANQAQIFGAASAMLVLLQQVMHEPLAL
jgi:hypothetical protein